MTTPDRDTALDSLSDARERAGNVRNEWHKYLDACHDELSLLHTRYDSHIDRLSNEGDDLYERMGDAFSRSKDYYSSGDHDGAGEWSARGRELKAELAAVNDEKNSLIAELKQAQAKFNDARDEYRVAKSAHEHAQEAFDERLAEVRLKRAVKRDARARRKAAKAPTLVNETERDAIRKATRTFQCEDDDVRVVFERDFDHDLQTWVASIYVYHRTPEIDKHVHALFREDNGAELMCEYHDDHA
jgi:hypothetical protein